MIQLFELAQNKIFYRIQRTRRRKTVGIAVLPDLQVVVRVPGRLPQKEIDRILEKRAEWILKKQSDFVRMKERFAPCGFTAGEKIPYLGGDLILELRQEAFPKAEASLQGETLIIPLSERDEREVVQRKVLKWYSSEALKEIQKSIESFSSILEVSPRKVSIRNQKRLWGSCTDRHHLSFNWRLILLPRPLLDYIVAHELCHILHLDHSEKFWKKLEELVPDSQEKRRWLKERSLEYLTFLREQ